MLKFSALVLLFAVAVFWPSSYAHHSEAQDRAIEALTNEWLENMKSIREPYQSWAIEKIKDAKTKDWNSIGDYYVELLNICQQVVGKSESELAISKRETSEGALDFKVSYLLQLAVNMLAKAANESERPILEKKFDEALKMKWNNNDDYLNYCYNVFKDVTGVDLKNYGNSN